jgi:transposase
MNHLAIDLGSRESQICVRNSEGQILEEERRPTTGLGKYLTGKEKSRVVLESCAEAFAVADEARRAGHEVVVVPSSLVRATFGMRRI